LEILGEGVAERGLGCQWLHPGRGPLGEQGKCLACVGIIIVWRASGGGDEGGVVYFKDHLLVVGLLQLIVSVVSSC
jgi:hypothetical protein